MVVDTHAHGPHFVPQPYRSLYRLLNRRTMPPPDPFEVLSGAGVDAVVATAVGDPIVTRWYRGNAYRAVITQLEQLRTEIAAAGGGVLRDSVGVRAAHDSGVPGIILGVEGVDAIGEDLDKLDELYRRDVRLVVPVHLGDNQIGTTSLPWQRYVGPVPLRRRRTSGLTEFGHAVITRLNELGMIIDVSHCDSVTTHDVVAASRHPVIASHSGARACDPFERYLTDDEIDAIAAQRGLIGLWPYFYRGRGVRDIQDLIRHLRHLVERVGAAHICIGTDMNGVPGAMAGYGGEADLPRWTEAMTDAGLTDDEVRGVLGENFLRVFSAVVGA